MRKQDSGSTCPVWRPEHLSDPAHIRWFPCLRYLPAAPGGPAPIGRPGPLLFPPHSLILRRLATSPFSPFPPPQRVHGGETHLSPHTDQFNKLNRRLTSHLCPHSTNTAALTTTFLFLLVPILGKQSISLTDDLEPPCPACHLYCSTQTQLARLTE